MRYPGEAPLTHVVVVEASRSGSGEIWGDVGRYGEMWGDVGRCGEASRSGGGGVSHLAVDGGDQPLLKDVAVRWEG